MPRKLQIFNEFLFNRTAIGILMVENFIRQDLVTYHFYFQLPQLGPHPVSTNWNKGNYHMIYLRVR